MKRVAMIIAMCLLALISANQMSAAADLKEQAENYGGSFPARTPKDQKDVKDLLEKWLIAQNSANSSRVRLLLCVPFPGSAQDR